MKNSKSLTFPIFFDYDGIKLYKQIKDKFARK